MLTVSLAELPADFRVRALQWASSFPHCAYFEHSDLQRSAPSAFERLLAVSAAASVAPASLADLQGPDDAAAAGGQSPPRCGFVTYDV